MKKIVQEILVFFVLPVIVPSIILVIVGTQYSVNVPYADEWAMVPIFQKIDNGASFLGELWRPWNEHRIFFPKLTLATAAYITNWNMRAEVILNIFLGVVSVALIYLLIRRTVNNSRLRFLVLFLSSVLMLSPVQSENWLWGWNIVWFMCLVAAISTIYLLDRVKNKNPYPNLLGAAGTAFITTFSLGGGLTIWLVGILILLVKRQTKKILIIWASFFLLSVGAYYFRYQSYNPQSSITAPSPSNAINFVQYISVMFGRPFTGDLGLSMLIGTAILMLLVPVAFIAWKRRKNLDKFLPWLAIIIFVTIACSLITVGRVGNGIYSATSSRYTTFPLLYFVGIVGLMTSLLDSSKLTSGHKKSIMSTGLLISLPLIYSSYSTGIYTAALWRDQLLPLKECTHSVIVSDDCLLRTNYTSFSQDTTSSREQLEFLKTKHWGGY